MKKLITILLFTFIAGLGKVNAQAMLTYDVNAVTQLGTISQTIATSTETVNSQFKLFEDIYSKVNTAVKTVSSVRSIIYNTERAFKCTQNTINLITKHSDKLSADYINRSVNSIDNNVIVITTLIEDVASFLGKSSFKMSDYERFSALSKNLEELERTTSEMEKLETQTNLLLRDTYLLESLSR